MVWDFGLGVVEIQFRRYDLSCFCGLFFVVGVLDFFKGNLFRLIDCWLWGVECVVESKDYD